MYPHYRKRSLLLGCAVSALVLSLTTAAAAQQVGAAGSTNQIGTAASEVVVTGTREKGQTTFTAISPVDTFSARAVNSTVTTNLDETLAQLEPSFNVKRLPASDGPEFIKPLSIHNLSPDMTLLLLNGKRFHSSAFIQGSGASASSQPADLAQIPTFALAKVEVLDSDASAQYGSDAIAGVVNVILNTRPGLDFFAQGSQYYAGDGTGDDFGLRAASALPGGGHLMVTAEYANNGLTSRTNQRPDALAFQATNPQLNIPDPVQRWGNPETSVQKYAFDTAEPLGDLAEAYLFGTLGSGFGIADINWRNPSTNPAVFGKNPSQGVAPAIFPGFNLAALFPAGFTPQEGERYNDQQVDLGVRHKASDTFTWDLSASYGHNDTGFFLNRSINASLGPASPYDFQLGHYMETEFDLNADFDDQWRTGLFADPVNVAFGAERRVETFEARSGDPASYAVGPGAAAGLAPGSNGFPGINLQQSGTHDETSYAGYVDVTVPVTHQLSGEFAARDESYDLFGDTFNYKIAVRYELVPELAMRLSYATGFKAPTPGQLFSTTTSQGLDTKTLQLYTTGRLSPLNPVAELLGAKPLTPETANTINGGLVWKTHFGLSGQATLFQTDVDHRLQQSPSFTLTANQKAALAASGVQGASAFTTVSFYTNAFSTATRGVDLRVDYTRRIGPGVLGATAAYSYTNTQVTGGSLSTAANLSNRITFERGVPQHNASATATYILGPVSLLGRMSYYGSWTDVSGNATGDIFQNFGGVAFFDLQLSYQLTPHIQARVGVENVANTYPEKASFQASRGIVYSRNSPYDTNGGNYFGRLEARF